MRLKTLIARLQRFELSIPRCEVDRVTASLTRSRPRRGRVLCDRGALMASASPVASEDERAAYPCGSRWARRAYRRDFREVRRRRGWDSPAARGRTAGPAGSPTGMESRETSEQRQWLSSRPDRRDCESDGGDGQQRDIPRRADALLSPRFRVGRESARIGRQRKELIRKRPERLQRGRKEDDRN